MKLLRPRLRSFNPAVPEDHSLIEAAPLRDQFNSLKSLIDAVPGVTSAVVTEVTTLPPEDLASASVTLVEDQLRFTFGITQGQKGDTGEPGPTGGEGPPGEVSTQQLNEAMSTVLYESSHNSNTVANNLPPAPEFYEQNQMQALLDKVTELITALRR